MSVIGPDSAVKAKTICSRGLKNIRMLEAVELATPWQAGVQCCGSLGRAWGTEEGGVSFHLAVRDWGQAALDGACEAACCISRNIKKAPCGKQPKIEGTVWLWACKWETQERRGVIAAGQEPRKMVVEMGWLQLEQTFLLGFFFESRKQPEVQGYSRWGRPLDSSFRGI